MKLENQEELIIIQQRASVVESRWTQGLLYQHYTKGQKKPKKPHTKRKETSRVYKS